MGTIFWLFGYISGYVAILAMAMCIASALYLLSEFAEEFPATAAKIIKYLIVAAFCIQIILWIDGLPTYESLFQCIAIFSYVSMIQTFPVIQLFSISTVSSIFLFLSTNLLWLRYFLSNHKEPLPIVGFFLVVVWAVPCGLFVSVTLGDHILPDSVVDRSSDHPNNGIEGRKKNFFRNIYDALADSISSMFAAVGLHSPSGLVQAKRR